MNQSKNSLIGSLPAKTGVYLLKDKKDNPIYIGKAKNIKSRVNSYFSSKGDNRPQTLYIIRELVNVDFIVTKNEREALLLENSLIKRHKPKFNIRLKDDKTYASLCLTVKEKFPKLIFTRRVKEDGSIYYGPFASGDALKQTKRLIHTLFPVRDCTDVKFKRHWQRPCLNYNLNLCLGPCAGKVTEEKYEETVNQAKIFLSGNRKELVRVLEKSMYKASEELRYEDAAYYRDQIKLMKKNIEVDKHITSNQKDKDILGFYKSDKFYEFVVLFSRDGSIVDKVGYSVKNLNVQDKHVLQEFLSRFYQDGKYVPREVLIQAEIDDKEMYEGWLSDKKGKKVEIIVPKKGSKLKLIQLAVRNARESYKKKKLQKNKELELLDGLKKSLLLSKVPKTIECFDISNIQGDTSVASLVRFKDGRPEKKRYRRYRVKTVYGPNDFASMYEILARRFKRADQDGWGLPDLIIIDGGKGQLNIAYQAIRELGYKDGLDLISIAKGRKKSELDKIYIYGKRAPYVLSENKKELFLLMRIRDEAHRFAIEYHKKLRSKKLFSSALDDIPGIGKKRRALLLNHFESTEKIKSADLKEIISLPGMSEKVAKAIKENLV